MSDHAHEHAPGTPAHEHGEGEILEIFPGETLKVRFLREDGSYVTVHWRETPEGPELRACGSGPIVAVQIKPAVIAVTEAPVCHRCGCEGSRALRRVGGVCELCRQLATSQAAEQDRREARCAKGEEE